VYPYQEDGPRLGSIVLRPIVPITLVGKDVGYRRLSSSPGNQPASWAEQLVVVRAPVGGP